MEIVEERRGEVRVVRVAGPVGDADLVVLDQALGRPPEAQVGGGATVVDLSRAVSINSQAISVLLSAWRREGRKGRRFVLSGPRGAVGEVLRRVRIDAFVPTVGSLEAAFALLEGGVEAAGGRRKGDGA